jgi:hypothetical protein
MNPLEAIKQKLKVKPIVEKRQPVEVILQTQEIKETKDELPVKAISQKLTIIDKRNEGFDRETLMKKLAESKVLKVTVKPILKATEEQTTKAPLSVPETKRAKKMTQKPMLIIEEEPEEEALKEGELEELPKEEIMAIQAPKQKERKTKKAEKGIAVLGPESVVIIKDTPLAGRVPKKQPTTIVRVSDYYMNNREIFVNFINALFEPYKKELEENKENISCDSIGQDSSDFSLLTHQKIVRDYMNLYTPYRGLLLYHGLGSGKCHAKGTPIIMYNGKIELIENIKVGDLLMGDDSTPRRVTSLARGKDKMYDIVPVKGEKYTVNEEHILCLKNQNNNIIEIAVKDYLTLTDDEKKELKGYKVAVEFTEKEIPIDPYQFGYYLDEKTSSIPFIYKCNSRLNRLKLLAGLLDKQGDFNNGVFELVNEKIMDDILYLIRSLGFAGDLNECKNKISIYGEGIEQIPTFKFGSTFLKGGKQIKNVLVTGISVNYIREDDYYGFTLDGNCRYLMGDFTVTHNTCTSIAIAEGMKEAKRVIIMTPASLRTNYMEQLKKCGDLLYKKNQFWEFISNPDVYPAISATLNLPLEYIRKKKGAWFVNVQKKSNYNELSSTDKKSLDDQLDEMIRNKYIFINYNGLRNKRLEELTSGFTKNLFDHSIVIIDEAHNLVSRIVNKIKKEKPIPETDKGEKEHAPKFLSTKLYEYLMSAQDARIVLLTGTPVINYPNEFGILFNILRGYIKTWEITLDIKTSQKIDQNSLREMLLGVKTLDYLEYSPSSKVLTITRNPFGFKNNITKREGYQGVAKSGTFDTDDEFERHLISVLKKNDIEIVPRGIKIRNKKALPDTMELFEGNYIDNVTKELKNVDALKRRILGLSSYFRSAQESLLPKYNKILGVDYHIVRIPMSNFQFKIYEEARIEERKLESKPKKKAASNTDELYKDPSSTYRIFSRLFCNFVMPERPMPRLEFSKEKENENEKEEKTLESILKQANKKEEALDITNDQEGEVEGDEILNELGGETYKKRLEEAIQNIETHSNDFLSVEALQTYSPKFLHILENIQDPEHVGLNLIYSQFRTLEGVGIFSLVLKKNGFAQFKIKKNTAGQWSIDIPEADQGKPTFALYSGTETAEEKEIIRNIYNGDWNYLPTNIASELRTKANNNNLGEIIKVLMITSSGSEGINLRNTRYVHIMEPYWHPVRLEQVIGRARRICSHKDLPQNLQTVEVFVYLMEFTAEQLKSDASIELKRKDLSKSVPHVPVTSDQYLYEISEMKLNLTNQLTDIIKQSAFDCSIYANGKCVSFAEPTKTQFSYVPDYAEQQSDITIRSNIKKIEWVGKSITINGVEYVYRRISPKVLNIYDKKSYLDAMQNPGINPILVGTYEINEKGQQVFRSSTF